MSVISPPASDISVPHVPLALTDPSWPEVSVVIPVYRGQNFIVELVARLHKTLSAISERYQIVLVDDRSPDQAWDLILKQADADQRVLGIRLSRNFGQQAAITAGMAHARANWYVVMDGDLQDTPEDIAQLYKRAVESGAQAVIAERATSGFGAARSLSSLVFTSVLRWSSGLDVSERIGNFRIFSNQVAEAYRSFPEQLRFFSAIMSQVGFETIYLPVQRAERPDGRSSYTFSRLLKLAFETIVAYSERPLRYMAGFGLIACLASVAFGIAVVAQALINGTSVPGYPSLAALVAFLSGVQISLISFVGVYVGRVFAEAKQRPVFIVDEVRGGRSRDS